MTGSAYARAHRLAQVGRYQEAEEIARAALAESPRDGRLLTLLAAVQRMRRRYAPALAAADAAVAAAPHLSDAHAERAEILILLIRAADAVGAAEEAVRLDPLDPAGHLVLARALSAARDTDRACSAAAAALALAPNSVDALLTVADVERDAGHREAALAAARAALALSPSNPSGLWLVAMLDAERLRVRRSMRALRDVARAHPARPDLISMTWPIRGVLTGSRRGLAAGGALICVLLLVARWWAPSGSFARLLSAMLAAVLLGFAARVLAPAGGLPWRSLSLLPPMMRRADILGLATVASATALLVTHAATGWWPAAALALASAAVLWAFGWMELIGAGLDDPGFRHAFAGVATDLRDWWRTTKRDLRAAWADPPSGKPR